MIEGLLEIMSLKLWLFAITTIVVATGAWGYEYYRWKRRRL